MKYEVSCVFCGHTQIYSPRGKVPPKRPHTDCKKCGKDFIINIETSDPVPKIPKNTKPKILEKTSSAKNPPIEQFIDDPSELLLSVAIRELNRPNPDPRWASILINCKKEKITNTNEVIDQFKQLPTQALVNLLSKSLQEEP